MRAVFVAITVFFAVLAVLCLGRAAAAAPDTAQVVRWVSAGIACAFIAVFWEVVRRRYVATGSLQSDAVTTGLGVLGVLVLCCVIVVFRLTS